MSASSAGEVMPCTTTLSSSGALGSRPIASIACALSCRKRASISGFESSFWRNHLHARDEVRPAGEELEHAEAALALHHEVVRAFGAGDVAHHLAGGADPVEVRGLHVVGLRIALQEEADLLLAAHRFLRGGDRLDAPDGDRRDHAREQHRVAHRDDDERVVRQRLDGRLLRRRGVRGRRLVALVGQHFLVHAPSLRRNVRVSTPSSSALPASSSGV